MQNVLSTHLNVLQVGNAFDDWPHILTQSLSPHKLWGAEPRLLLREFICGGLFFSWSNWYGVLNKKPNLGGSGRPQKHSLRKVKINYRDHSRMAVCER